MGDRVESESFEIYEDYSDKMAEKNWTPQVTRYEKLLSKFLDQYGIAHESNPVIAGYYPDIVITGTNVIIEVDGSIHATIEQHLKDQERTKHLEAAGYKVLRITNWKIVNKPTRVIYEIRAFLFQARTGVTIKQANAKKAAKRPFKKSKKKPWWAKANVKSQTLKKKPSTTPKKAEVVRVIKAES